MHILARPAILSAKKLYPRASAWLDGWWFVASKSKWTRLADVRVSYPRADEIGQCLVFDACGNDYRLICRFSYANEWTEGTLLIRHFLTHAEYDKKKWCIDCVRRDKKL